MYGALEFFAMKLFSSKTHSLTWTHLLQEVKLLIKVFD